jgi:hypothetical protein
MTQSDSPYKDMPDGLQFTLSDDASHKLTDWEKEPSILTLKHDLEAARPAQQAQVARITGWNNLMHGRLEKLHKVKGRSHVQPRLIRRQAEWRYSALSEPFLGSNKLFKVSPATWSDEDSARQNEMVLNWQFRTKMNRVQFIDNFVRATVDEGTSIVRVGWKRVTLPAKKTVPIFTHYQIENPQQAQQLQQAIALKQADPRSYPTKMDPATQSAVSLYEETGQTTYAQQTGEEEQDSETVIENRPTLEVLNPANVFIDPSCLGQLDRALFIIVSFETNKAELLKEPDRYKHLDQVNWEGNAPMNQLDHVSETPDSFAANFNDQLRRKVVAYEYWGFCDIHGDGRLQPIVATWIGASIIRMELNPYPDQKLPFVVVPYLPRKRELYGEPDAELLEDNQNILGAVSRGMIDLLGRSANAQQGFAKGMLDALNRRRYDEGKDYEFNPSVNPSQGLIEHRYPELPQSAMQMLDLQNSEAEALTGVKSFAGGLSGQAYGPVASNARSMVDAAAKREMAILRRLAKGVCEMGEKIIAMNAEFMTEEETIQVTDDTYVEISREDLKGNFHLETDISTIEVDEAKAQDLGFMLQTLGPTVDPSISMTILAEICDLKRMPALAHKLRGYKPPPPSPEQQQMQQLELQKADLHNKKLQSDIDLNEAHAKQLGAKTDMTNLDYVEKETGTTHARNLQVQQAQSVGNQNLEVTKALTKPMKEGEKPGNISAAVGFNQLSHRLSDPLNSNRSNVPTNSLATL